MVAVSVSVFAVVAVAVLVTYKPPEAAILLPDAEPPEWQVTVSGDGLQEKVWTLEEISEMPLTTVIREVDGENATYVGVTLYDFCFRIGMPWDTESIKVVGGNEQVASLNIYQAWNSTVYPYYQVNNRIALVFVRNGEWLTEASMGPVLLVAPYFPEEYQVQRVSEVHLGSWTISVSGKVPNPLVISSQNLTLFEELTVEAQFVPGDGERTSDWTGLSVLDVLEAANRSNRASKMTVVAVDGYEKTYTMQEVEEAQMLIGYKENGNYLQQSQGGPYRIFCTAEKYKWAQFWVKFIKEIIIA